MVRAITLFCLVAVVYGGTPVAAQNPNIGSPDVLVKLMPGTPRQIRIGPRGFGVCKNANVCADNFTVMWVGAKNDGEQIRINFTTPGASHCFDKVDFTVEGIGASHKVTVTLAPNSDCPMKAAFFFDVSCTGGESGNCGGVVPVDPGAMVDGGNGG
jgi:hypothetical protein